MQAQSLITLIEHSTRERDEAAADLRAAEGRAAAAANQQRQLADYRTDYRQRWTAQFGGGGGMEIVQCYQNFADRLEQAMVQQAHSMSHLEQQVLRLRQQLAQRELRLASVRKLMERRQAALAQSAARQEQKATDEAALRARPPTVHGLL